MATMKQRPVAVDVIILAIAKEGLEILLVQIKDGKNIGKWAAPGRLLGWDESLEEAAREIINKGVSEDKLYLEQLRAFGEVDRDVKGRSVAIVFLALLGDKDKMELKQSEVYKDLRWFPLKNVPVMAFGHREMVRITEERLVYMLDEVEIVRRLLPEKFSLSELQRIHEVLSGKKMDKRNFVKKIKADDSLEFTGEYKVGAFRPAKLYRFK